MAIQHEVASQSAAFSTFVARLGEEFGPYDSPQNGTLIVDRVLREWGREGAYSPDAYEIAFRQLVAEGTLTKDEHYVPPSILAEIESTPAGELARRYRMDVQFRLHVDNAARAGRKFQ